MESDNLCHFADRQPVELIGKKLFAFFNINNFYEEVRSGKWTLETFYRYVGMAAADLNGDNVMDDKDRYGITSHYKQMLPCFWISSALRSISKNKDDEPEFSLAGSEKFSDFYFDFSERMHTGNVWYDSSPLSNYADNTLFKEDRALFNVVRLHFMQYYRDMATDFGMIPFPKYDEAQDKYYSRTEGGLLPVVPITASGHTELIGAVMETMSAYSRFYVVPVYYETVLKNKFARDEDSIEMLDIIFENRVYDLGDTIWNAQVRDGVFAAMFRDNSQSLISSLESMKTAVDSKIAVSLELFDKLL